MLDKKELKTNRMKTYFVSAAKTIISKQGVEKLSVRNVADNAGYSYATIYNYYKDLDSLLWDVKKSFTEDLIHSLVEKEVDNQNQDIIKGFQVYAEFFVNNPNLFRFFFLWPISCESEHAQETLDLFANIFDMSSTSLAFQFDIKEKETVFKTCIYTLHGLLLLFYSANGMEIKAFWDDFYSSMGLILLNE